WRHSLGYMWAQSIGGVPAPRGPTRKGENPDMSLKRVVCACLVAGVATQVAIVGTAAAAPVNSKNASVIPVFCSDNNSYDVVTISNSGGNSGHQGFNAAHIL